jgi:hypothetical protein
MEILKNSTRQLKGLGVEMRQITYKKKENQMIHPKDIKLIAQGLADKFQKKYKRMPKILIRARNQQGNITIDNINPKDYKTIKGYKDEIDDMFEDYEDYLAGRVKSTTKFMEFNLVEFSLT